MNLSLIRCLFWLSLTGFFTLCSASQTFSYHELIDAQNPGKRAILKRRLCGSLAEWYETHTFSKTHTDDMQETTITHCITDIPSTQQTPVSLQLDMKTMRAYSSMKGFKHTQLCLWDSHVMQALATCTIAHNNEGRSSSGSLYWSYSLDNNRDIPARTVMLLRDTILALLDVQKYILNDKSWDHVLTRFLHGKALLHESIR